MQGGVQARILTITYRLSTAYAPSAKRSSFGLTAASPRPPIPPAPTAKRQRRSRLRWEHLATPRSQDGSTITEAADYLPCSWWKDIAPLEGCRWQGHGGAGAGGAGHSPPCSQWR